MDSIPGVRRPFALWTYFWIYTVLLYAPLLVLALFSLHDSTVLALPWQGFSLRWYRAMLESAQLLRALRTSLLVAFVSAFLALLLGTAAAIAVTRFRFRGRGLLLIMGLTPFVIPYLGLAVALLLTFLAVGIKPSIMTIIIAHSVIGIPSVLLLLGARLIGIDPALEEAALDLGATWLRVIRRIYLPLLVPALIAGFVAAFVLSFNEFYLAVFLAGPDTTMPVYFFSGFRSPDLMPPTLALNTVLTVIILVIAAITQVALRRGAK